MATQLSCEGLRRVVPISAEYGLGRGVAVLDGMLQDSMSGRAEHPVDITKAKALPGQHNHQNAAAAYAQAGSATADRYGISATLDKHLVLYGALLTPA